MRPEFIKLKSEEEFLKYYWYKNELIKICKESNINHIGTKSDLENRLSLLF